MRLCFDQLAFARGHLTMVDGAFDPLHPGHLAYFRAAQAYGLPLLCNICPDRETTKKHAILLPAAQRAEVLAALDSVAYVHVSDRPTADVLRAVQPRYYVKGADWRGRLPIDHVEACAAAGTEIVYTDTPQQSSTVLLRQFQPDLDAFERFVFSQKPAEKPWEPTVAVPYDFESRKVAEGRHPELIREVLAPKTAFDYGCGPGHLLAMLRNLGIDAEGYEPSEAQRHLEQPNARPHIVRGWRPSRRYDLVICREVLEHCTIRQIKSMVPMLCGLSSGLVYVTTRFTQPRHFLDFADHDDLDPTHITILSKPWLRHLFILEGFKSRPDLEAAMDWKHLGRCLVYERV